MDGAIAFDLVARYPDLLAAIVAVDAPVVVPPEVGMAIAGPLMGATGTPNWNRALRDFMASAINPKNDPVRRERILTAMEAFQARISQAEIRRGFGGHWVQLEAPDRVNAAIDNFVRAHSGDASH